MLQLLVAIGLLLISFFKPEFNVHIYRELDLLSVLATLIGLNYFFEKGGIRKTFFFWLFLFCGLLLLSGTLFIAQHWPYGKLMREGSIGLILLAYLFRFFKKKQKNFPDYLKLIWAILKLSSLFLYNKNVYFSAKTETFSQYIFLALLVYFLVLEINTKGNSKN